MCSVTGLGLTSCNNDDFLNVTQYEVVDQAASYESRANAKRALNGVYDMMYPNDSYDGDWGFKPNLFTGCHPTIDTQATGWDKNWNVQAWNSGSTELLSGWKHVYAGICRANDFLENLKTYPEDVVDASLKKDLEGEGRALRGFFYHWLATTFGRVPMLATGETFINTPEKARAATYALRCGTSSLRTLRLLPTCSTGSHWMANMAALPRVWLWLTWVMPICGRLIV